MMKTVFAGIVVIALAIGMPGTLTAQDSSVIKTLQPVTVKAKTKKIPPKVWEGFSGYFTEAENPRWYELNKYYLVKFMIYDQQNKALYNKRGKMVYHISYGYEKTLPRDLGKLVNTVYPDYDIYRAIKIMVSNREVWVLNLQDDMDLVMVRVENGELEEVQRLRKSP